MKRFVTYLYECERGNKIKNVGFIRVNVRGSETTMEVYIRNFQAIPEEGIIYALTYKEAMQGIHLGSLTIEDGHTDEVISFEAENIGGSGIGLNDIEGIAIRFNSGKYIASCWRDDYAGEIASGEFSIREETDALVATEEVELLDEPEEFEGKINYEKIDISQIRDLPSPNWHLASNSFLVHGFWNYGYLVLKKEMEEGKKKLFLGVPGVFEKPEAVMAILFGFPEFEPVTKELVMMEKEKNQEAEVGTFGYWFVKLKV